MRKLVRSPREIPALVLTLAIGLGTACAAWTVLEATLVRPLPYPDSAQLVRIWDAIGGPTGRSLTDRQFRMLRSAESLPIRVAIYQQITGQLKTIDRMDARPTAGLLVSAEFFDVLGATPLEGRTFGRPDEDLAATPSIIVSERLRAEDPRGTVLGQQVLVDGVAYSVIGVMPADFHFPDRATTYWLPVVNPPGELTVGAQVSHYSTIGKLERGQTIAAAQAQLTTMLSPRGVEDKPALTIRRLLDDLTAQVRAPLILVQAVALIVLGLASANAAWLFGWRVRRLRDSFAIMSAFGATVRRVLCAYAIEVCVITALSTGAALAISWAFLRILLSQSQGAIPRLWEAGLSSSTMVLTLAVACLATVAAAIPGAVMVARICYRGTMPSRAGATRSGRAREYAAMAMQTGVVFALATQAVLMGVALRDLVGNHVGFDDRDLIVVRVSFPSGMQLDAATQASRYEELLATLENSGIHASVTNAMPLSSYHSGLNLRLGPDQIDYTMVGLRIVSPSYADVVGLRLVAGRHLSVADTGSSHVIVNDVLARELLGGTDAALGKRVTLGAMRNPESQIVGVVQAVRHMALLDDPDPEIYSLYLNSARFSAAAAPNVFVVAPASSSGEGVVEQAIMAQFPEAKIAETRYFKDLAWAAAADRPLLTLGVTAFAIIGLVIMMAGLHGLVGRGLEAESREIAIRMSLGASPRRVLIDCLRTIASVYTMGLVVGFMLLFLIGRTVSATVFVPSALQVPSAVLVSATAALILAVVVAAACYRPLRTAVETDPVAILRAQ